jgi:hypothetical protein
MPETKGLFHRPRVYWVIAGGILIVILAAAIVGLVYTQAAPQQPFPYTHAPHIEKGIPCIYCHSGAYRGQSAGLPTKAKCQGCHQNIKADTPLLQQWDEYARDHDQIEWVPVALMPDFVYFSHQPHLNAGIDCINCHGDLSKMTTAEPQNYWTMGWCLGCHKTMAPEKFVKLSDCATCHK